MTLGEQIQIEILPLVRAEASGLCVWAPNSPEILEAIVAKFAPLIPQSGGV